MTGQVDRLAARLDEAFARTRTADALQWISRPLLGLLANGQPVTAEDLAVATDREVDEIRRVLPTLPSIELDEQGRVVGYGITLNPAPHHFTVDGRQLYTWCALDTLLFPALLNRTADVESPCHGTGTSVRVRVEPTGVRSVEPTSSVVSIVTPEEVSAIRSSFCNYVHFFSSAEAARGWLEEHPAAAVLPVAEAFDLGRRLAAARFGDTATAPAAEHWDRSPAP